MGSTLEELRRGFGGDIIEPGSAPYAAAARTLLVQGSPAWVLRPKGVADVRAAVAFAAGAGLALAVRGGGHAFPGFATNDGGVVIDLGNLATVEIVDPVRHVVRIGGGATWGQVADALAPHGLAISSGDTRGVGVGGLTLSGGIGWKVRKYGLALDALLAAEVVTAGGQVLRASAAENSELFWAVRGGGGNSGIVTAFEFAAHPTTDVVQGRLAFPAAETAGVLLGWARYMRTAPEALTAVAEFANPFAGGRDAPLEIRVAYDGDDPAAAARALDPIRALGRVIADEIAPGPYGNLLVEGMTPPPGIQLAARSGFTAGRGADECLRILAEAGAADHPPAISVRSVGGAVARIPADATAYAHRQAELMVATTVVGPAPAIEGARAGLDALWDRLAPHIDGAYANFLSSAADTDVASVYPQTTYDRLAAVKRRYDPANLFAGNHNVRP